MNSIYILLSAFVLTCTILLALRPAARPMGLLDIPGGRKTHKNPTPMIGGIGIYLSVLAVCLLSPALLEQFKWLLVISGLVLVSGVIDDMIELRASLRILIHAAAAWAMAVTAGVQLVSFGDVVFVGPIMLGLMAVPLTMFATVGVVNAINMSDGLDGLSAGVVTIALIMLSVAALVGGDSAFLSFSQILIVSLLAFLAFNFRQLWKKSALMYLGDAGSTFLGFMLAWLIIAASQGPNAFIAPVTALWILAIPLMDTVNLLVRRPLRGESPFKPGRDHLHHRLLNAGFDVRQTVLIIHAATFVTGSIGLAGYFLNIPEGLMFMAFLLVFTIYMTASWAALRPQTQHGARDPR